MHDILTGTTPPVEWLVPDLLPRGSLIAMAGEPGTGKSVFSYSLAVALTAGRAFLGAPPQPPRRVLYFDQENADADSIQYFRWAWHGNGCPAIEGLDERLFFAPFQLGSADWPAKIEASIRAVHPDLLVIDTATSSLAVKDENDNGEATTHINELRRLMAITVPKAACLVLKHAKIRNEDGKYTLRGAKQWEGLVDGILYLTRKRGRPRTDGLATTILNSGKTRAFGLREPLVIVPHWVGEDRRGIALERGHLTPLREPD